MFCRFISLLYFLGDKFTLELETFDWVLACKIRLMHCKVLLYCIWKGFEVVALFWGYSDSLVFLLIHSLSTKVEPRDHMSSIEIYSSSLGAFEFYVSQEGFIFNYTFE